MHLACVMLGEGGGVVDMLPCKFLICFILDCMLTGAYAGFLRGGGPTLKFLGVWIYMPRSCELLLGGLGGMLPKKIFKNGAISCVLRAIFKDFHSKKSSQKIINKHEFFH